MPLAQDSSVVNAQQARDEAPRPSWRSARDVNAQQVRDVASRHMPLAQDSSVVNAQKARDEAPRPSWRSARDVILRDAPAEVQSSNPELDGGYKEKYLKYKKKYRQLKDQ
jgi:hypothetical protein